MLLLFCLFLAATANAGQRVWFRPWANVTELAEVLQEIPRGREILAKAWKKDPKILSHVQPAAASYTEDFSSNQLTAFNGSGEATIDQQVNLKRGLPLSDAVADLAHELTHFTGRVPFDPYREGFQLSKFVRASIEGEGGELSAFRAECEVAWQLETDETAFPRHQICETYRGPGNTFREPAARAGFYALGNYYAKASPELRKAFPELTEASVQFKSGTSGKPYPLSLALDFESTRRKYCALNRAKYLLTARPAKGSGVSTEKLMEERKRLETFSHENCR